MRRPFLAQIIAAAAVASVLATAGCTKDDPAPTTPTTTVASPSAPASPSESATPEPTASVTPQPSVEPAQDEAPADSAPFVADLNPDTADPSAGALLSPVNIRFGAHDGYDRLVLDLVGTGTPGWLSEYVDDPTFEGSGGPVELAGDAYLVTHVRGLTYPTEPGASPYVGSTRFSPASAGVIEEVVVGAVFEGQADIYVGLSSAQPFRVFLLEDPTRVVIDVQHP